MLKFFSFKILPFSLQSNASEDRPGSNYRRPFLAQEHWPGLMQNLKECNKKLLLSSKYQSDINKELWEEGKPGSHKHIKALYSCRVLWGCRPKEIYIVEKIASWWRRRVPFALKLNWDADCLLSSPSFHFCFLSVSLCRSHLRRFKFVCYACLVFTLSRHLWLHNIGQCYSIWESMPHLCTH